MRNPWTMLTLLTAVLLTAPACVTAQDAAASDSTEDEAAGTFAEPSIINPTWSFDLEVSTPNAIAVPDTNGRVRWYWYAAYTVANNTGNDRLFIPEVVILTADGDIVQANRRIPPTVYSAIADRLNNRLLESPNDVVGRLLQGDDFAKESVAIWPASLTDVDEFTLFFSGADGETKPLLSPKTGQPIMQPALDPVTGEPKLDANGNAVMSPIMVRRTRAYTYLTPGTPGVGANLREQTVRLVDEDVVMR